MILSELSGVIGGLAAVPITAWIFSKVRPTASLKQGAAKVLRYHASYAILGWITFLLFSACAVCASFSHSRPRSLGFCWMIFGLFSLMGIAMILLHRRCSLAYGAEGLRYTPLWGKAFAFSWEDVESVHFSHAAKWWRLQLRDRRSVRVSVAMNGAVDFMATLAANTAVEIPPGRLAGGKVFAVGRG